ncbi:PepSY domain-containing protein [Phytopseudomonas dryadis]|uniref:Peptidase n=1 Tax=Phytopseudomonas dryadis TaxID=2487520 RepID=A0A4V2KD41_9GAMM|nr:MULTISPECIES: PepSY domain-containing protein [Pseudomonas]TBU97426.1 peptidase [Pseudomonas dryadis]TBV09898.1 peptidase [Pseudomonas dryadis]TBV15541.1 peptidase [Pseudomonas sp. FRB 230]
MKSPTLLFAAAALSATAAIAQARDLGPDEALQLRDAGTILSFEKLNEAALAQHPGGRLEGSELEEEYGRYLYQVEVRDAKGQQWDVELDATDGTLLKNHLDD